MNFRAKVKGILTDTLWSAMGLILMNGIAQLLVYPLLNRELGTEQYGNILTAISFINIFSLSFGVAINNGRLVLSSKQKTHDGDYGLWLLAGSIVLVLLGGLAYPILSPFVARNEYPFYILLSIGIMWRYYSDVYFRLNLQYKYYFYYYCFVSLGYVVGAFLFMKTKYWTAALLPGELVGIAYPIIRSRRSIIQHSEQFFSVGKEILILIGANIVTYAIFNADRLLLHVFIDGTAVTIYYIASLMGKMVSFVTIPINNVIIGYLSRYQGIFSKKRMNLLCVISLGLIFIATIGCLLASYIFLPILYPDNFLATKSLILICSMSQSFYFVSGVILVILLRFCGVQNQFMINCIYGVIFCVLGTVLSITKGIYGFCTGALLSAVIRYSISVIVGYRNVQD